jgi:hypothetical protein
VPVARQAPFAGSDRKLRGALLRELTASPHRRLTLTAARHLTGDRLEALLAGLERDRLAHRAGRFLRLGGRATGEATTTIAS